MVLLNNKMVALYKELVGDKKKLNHKLSKLINDGFVCKDDCYFLKTLFKIQAHVKRKDFIDATGYECFINAIHVDDYINNDFLVQANLFLDKIFKAWNELNNSLILKGIIGKTEYGASVRFHLMRENETWIEEADIDKFEEPLIIRTSG